VLQNWYRLYQMVCLISWCIRSSSLVYYWTCLTYVLVVLRLKIFIRLIKHDYQLKYDLGMSLWTLYLTFPTDSEFFLHIRWCSEFSVFQVDLFSNFYMQLPSSQWRSKERLALVVAGSTVFFQTCQNTPLLN